MHRREDEVDELRSRNSVVSRRIRSGDHPVERRLSEHGECLLVEIEHQEHADEIEAHSECVE